MSSISPESPGKIPPSYGLPAGSRLEITAAIKNEQGQWVTPSLEESEELAVQKGATETIREVGEQTQSWKQFVEEGALLEVTSSGVFVKEGEEWRDLLSGQEQEPLRESVSKTMSAVTTILGGKKEGKEVSKEVAANANALRQGDVVIQVRVVPTAPSFAKRYEAEQKSYENFEALAAYTRLPNVQESLQERGMSVEQVHDRMEELRVAAYDMRGAMNRVNTLLQEGKTQEAVELYIEEMPAHYEAFSEAMRLWQRTQRELALKLGTENPHFEKLFVDSEQIAFQIETAKELFTMAERTLRGQIETAPALEKMGQSKAHFEYDPFVSYDVEQEFFANLTWIANALSEEIEDLEGKGLDVELTRERIQGLGYASRDLLETLEKVNELLQEEKIDEAVELYADEMPARFGAFCDALRLWQRTQRELANILGTESPFYSDLAIDLQHIAYQYGVAGELFALAEGVNQVKTASALEQMGKAKANFDRELQLARAVEKEVSSALKSEKAYQETIEEALTALNDPGYCEYLIESAGWTQHEIDEHKKKFGGLWEQTDEVLEIFYKTAERLSVGEVQEGIDYFSQAMQSRSPEYLQALQRLAVPQKIAQFRVSDTARAPLEIDLQHIQEHAALLETVSRATQKADVVDLKGKIAIDEGEWEKALELLQAQPVELQKNLKLADMVGLLNQNLKRGQEYTERLGEFVKAYRGKPELFQRVMSEHGIDAFESSFLFDQYQNIYKALLEWDRKYQEVVDLANLENYDLLVSWYEGLAREGYPKLLDQLRAAYLNGERLKAEPVKQAFLAFAREAGIPDPELTYTQLSTARPWEDQPRVFEESLQLGVAGGVSKSEEAAGALKEMQGHFADEKKVWGTTNYAKELQLARTIEKEVGRALENEDAYLEEARGALRAAVTAFDKDAFTKALSDTGWQRKDSEAHRAQLAELIRLTNRVQDTLRTTMNLVRLGEVQRGIDLFSKQMQAHYLEYTQIAQAFAIPQKIAQARVLPTQLAPFEIDLQHGQEYVALLETVSREAQQAGVPAPSAESALEVMGEASTKLQTHLNLADMVGSLNRNQKSSQEFTARLGQFVKAYRENPEEFQRVMREHEIDEFESSFLFSHYQQVYEALQEWDKSYQKVVALADSRKYKAALEEYTRLAREDYPMLLDKLRGVYVNAERVNAGSVEEAFLAFAREAGIPEPELTYTQLSTAQPWEQPRMFEESLRLGAEGGISKLEGADEAIKLMKWDLKARIETWGTNYDEELRLARTVDQEVSRALESEKAYQTAVVKAIEAFNEERLLASGLSREEIDGYKEQLDGLSRQIDEVVELYGKTREHLRTGKLQRGIDDFSGEMQTRYPLYVQFAQGLAIIQKIAQAWVPEADRAPFALDLNHAREPVALLETVLREAKKAELPIVSIEGLESSVEVMKGASQDLQAHLKQADMVGYLNHNQKSGEEFTARLGEFVTAYRDNRGAFQRIMREHGISDLESSYIFNQYQHVYEALQKWDKSYQQVVNFANDENYDLALITYNRLVKEDYPGLLERLNGVYMAASRRQSGPVKLAFEEFAKEVGLSDPQRSFDDLRALRAGEKSLVFKECLQKAE
ncbi:hypothetical protein ACFLR2_02305, partial [Chlamydiota bacterium]